MANEDYVEARNRLIPIAEAHADRVLRDKPRAVRRKLWTRTFMRKMTELAVKEGLIPERWAPYL